MGEVGGGAGQKIVQRDHACGLPPEDGRTCATRQTRRRRKRLFAMFLHKFHSSEARAGFTCYIQNRTVYDRRILVGTGITCRNSPHFASPLLVAFPQGPERHPRFARHVGFRAVAARAADPPVPVGSHAAGQGDRAAPAARAGARLRFLGISGLRAGHRQPHRDRHSARRFLSQDSGFGSFYFGFVAVWAVAVAVSIAGLFVRRFVVRPVWLGKVSPESGFIAFLIFMLMVTYLAGLWMDEESLAGQGVLVAAHRWRCWSSCR